MTNDMAAGNGAANTRRERSTTLLNRKRNVPGQAMIKTGSLAARDSAR